MNLLLLFQVNCVLCVLYYSVCFVVHYPVQNMCRTTDLIPCVGHYNLASELDLPVCDYVDVENIEELRPNKNDLSIIQLNI